MMCKNNAIKCLLISRRFYNTRYTTIRKIIATVPTYISLYPTRSPKNRPSPLEILSNSDSVQQYNASNVFYRGTI